LGARLPEGLAGALKYLDKGRQRTAAKRCKRRLRLLVALNLLHHINLRNLICSKASCTGAPAACTWQALLGMLTAAVLPLPRECGTAWCRSNTLEAAACRPCRQQTTHLVQLDLGYSPQPRQPLERLWHAAEGLGHCCVHSRGCNPDPPDVPVHQLAAGGSLLLQPFLHPGMLPTTTGRYYVVTEPMCFRLGHVTKELLHV
jgi:hypothetical protein